MSTALLVIDLQYDFLPGGSLAVPEGDQTIPVINKMIDTVGFDHVVYSQDYHPANHMSFSSNNPGTKPFDVKEIKGDKQVMWPDHCVQGTRGSLLHPSLHRKANNPVVVKGTRVEIDSYSAFYDNNKEHQTELQGLLRKLNVSTVFVCGLATDFCVAFTALDAVECGFTTYFVEDASRGIDAEGVKRQIANMKDAGVVVIQSDDVGKRVQKRPALPRQSSAPMMSAAPPQFVQFHSPVMAPQALFAPAPPQALAYAAPSAAPPAVWFSPPMGHAPQPFPPRRF